MVKKIGNWTKNRRKNKEKKCGSRLAAAASRKKNGKKCEKKEGRNGQNHRKCEEKVVRFFATQSKE